MLLFFFLFFSFPVWIEARAQGRGQKEEIGIIASTNVMLPYVLVCYCSSVS